MFFERRHRARRTLLQLERQVAAVGTSGTIAPFLVSRPDRFTVLTLKSSAPETVEVYAFLNDDRLTGQAASVTARAAVLVANIVGASEDFALIRGFAVVLERRHRTVATLLAFEHQAAAIGTVGNDGAIFGQLCPKPGRS